MSQSPTHALSTRLFIQAALTGLLAPTAAGGSTWMVLTLAVAAGAVAVGFLLRNAPANAKRIVVGFEGVALVVGGLGLAGGHYIPGTIIGVVTLITALNMPAGGPVSADAQWVPPPAGFEPAPAFGAAPAYAPPAPPAPVAPPAPPAVATPPAQPLPPEDIPPAPRSMTILPGK